MPRNIILICDGTSNEIAKNRTNMLRLYGTLIKDEQQMVFYDPGVGTFGAANAWSYGYRRFLEIWGLATGWGLDRNVKQAYTFLVNHYREGDRIYLFGFSRGAYTARVLAGFLHAFGLMKSYELNLLDYAYRAYKNVGGRKRRQGDARDPKFNAFAEVNLFERMLDPYRPTIRALGLFDTVGSVIEVIRYRPRIRGFAHTSTNASVQAVRHAVGIDERRTMFQPSRWPMGQMYRKYRLGRSETPQDVKEVWFSGVHGDVGGGYPEDKSHLAKFPLEWMIVETRALGVRYDDEAITTLVLGENPETPHVGPAAKAAPNRSMRGFWPVVEVLPRIKTRFTLTRRRAFLGLFLPLFERRHIPAGAYIHESVFERRGPEADYEQPNIPDDHVLVPRVRHDETEV